MTRQLLEQESISDFRTILVTPDPEWSWPDRIRPDHSKAYEQAESRADKSQDAADLKAALILLGIVCLFVAIGAWQFGQWIAGLIA